MWSPSASLPAPGQAYFHPGPSTGCLRPCWLMKTPGYRHTGARTAGGNCPGTREIGRLSERLAQAIHKIWSKYLLNSPYGPQKCSTERTRTVFGVGRASASAVTIRFKPSIIVRFYRRTIRNDIIRARRALKGSAVSIREDLTRLNQALLNRAMNHPRVDRAWTWNGKINVVGHNGNRVTLTPFCDIDSVLDIANLGH